MSGWLWSSAFTSDVWLCFLGSHGRYGARGSGAVGRRLGVTVIGAFQVKVHMLVAMTQHTRGTAITMRAVSVDIGSGSKALCRL